MSATFVELRAAAVPINRSCALLGRARATHYRHTRGLVHGPRPARAVPENGQALSAAERAAVLTLINTESYADLSIGQIWARELRIRPAAIWDLPPLRTQTNSTLVMPEPPQGGERGW